METIGTFDDNPLKLLDDVAIASGGTVRSLVAHNAHGRPACSIELHVTTAAPANLVLRVLGQNTVPASDTARLYPLTLALPDLSALTANYDAVFLLPMYTAYMQLEVASVSGAAVRVTAYALGADAAFDDAVPAAVTAVSGVVQLAAGAALVGHVIVDTAAPLHQAWSAGALVDQAQAYAAPCKLEVVSGYNAGPSQLYVQLHDKATALVAGDVPRIIIPTPGNRAAFSLAAAYAFAVGLSIGISSTELTYTSAGNYLSYEALVAA